MSDKLNKALTDIQKMFGKKAIGNFYEVESIPELFSTGSIKLDKVLGGFPEGRIIEIYGPEGSGKTTLSIHTLADVQKKEHNVAFIDIEGTFDPVYANALGLDVNKLIFASPSTGEETLEITEKLVRTGEVKAIVIDSVATLLPSKAAEGDYGDANMGLHARLMSQGLKKLLPVVKKNKTMIIFINQLREKIGVMFQSPETTPGGNSLKFYASVRLDIRKYGSVIKDKEGNVIGEPKKVKIIKSKINNSTGKEVFFDIIHGKGIDIYGEVLDLAVEKGFLEKSGSWYSYDGVKIAQGREASKQFLKDNPELFEEIKEKL